MKFGSLNDGSRDRPFVCLADGPWYDLNSLARRAGVSVEGTGLSLAQFISLGDEAVSALRATLESDGDLEAAVIDHQKAALLAPIPAPTKNIFCVGRNYRDHISEDNRSRDLQVEPPKYPQFFTKPPTAVIGHGGEIRLDHTVTRRLDYEVELAVVIGRRGRDIARGDVEQYIFGYTICNDVTARDLQRRHDQWFKGKALDTSCPLGPFIVHKSAIPSPQNLAIKLSVNGKPRQDDNTSGMIFDIATLISSLSAGMTLEPGDIIATGTPSGVGYAMEPRQFLQPDDRIACWIEGIGTLENTVVAA